MASIVLSAGLSVGLAPLQQNANSQEAIHHLKSSFSGAKFTLTKPGLPRKAVPSKVQASLLEKLPAKMGLGLSALGLAATLQFSPLNGDIARAAEYNILSESPPAESHLVDDAGVLNRVTKSDIKRLLTDLEERTGYHIDVVTLRKITSKGDVFEFADRVLETWYPTREEGDKKGVVVLITTAKEGAVTGGPAFIQSIGDELLEAIVTENLPVLATEEKYNEAMFSTAKRLVAKIDGKEDTGGPRFDDNKRQSNFKSRQETEEKRGQFTTVVGGLLVIAFVVPMLQYYAYVAKK